MLGVERWAFSQFWYSKSLSPKTRRKTSQNRPSSEFYGEGEVLTLISVFVSVLLSGAGDSLITVVLLSFFSPGGFATVVSFCSHAASNASPAKRHRYFFIYCQTDVIPQLFKEL